MGSRDFAEFDNLWLLEKARAFNANTEDGEGVTIKNRSDEVEILHLAGPNARNFIEKIAPGAGEIPFLGAREMVRLIFRFLAVRN